MLPALALACLAPRLEVGDGKPFSRIEAAVAAAPEGATIAVYPSKEGYDRTAVRFSKRGLRICGMGHVLIRGTGFDYRGEGAIPRAIFQIDPEGGGTTIENFELIGAHNGAHNGAGVRINAARGVTIRNCDIHGNDMGIMSNGTKGDLHAGEDQLVQGCRIYENGDPTDPGYNHNLYLGGTSVTVDRCDIYGAVTGHNLKSRAHFTLVSDCHFWGGDNRQLDFVDGWDTERPESNAVLVGNRIEMNPSAKGNRNVIHFGRESGIRNGCLFLLHNAVATPFVGAVLLLDSPSAAAILENNVILNEGQAAPELVAGERSAVRGRCNWISANYRLDGTGIETTTRYQAPDPIGQGVPVHSAYRDGEGKAHRVPESYQKLGPQTANPL